MATYAPVASRYRALIGVGGVGWGQFFRLNGSHTLGREESRSGRFLNQRDYCKLHIIAHYTRALLGPGCRTIPISSVGADPAGRRLRQEMADAGLDVRYLAEDPRRPTLYSLCFQYPDGTGGNLTVDDSAADAVTPQAVEAAETEWQRFAGQGIALAAPESPPEVRACLLRLATRRRFFRVAALTASEAQSEWVSGLLGMVDLAALNLEEAAALAQVDAGRAAPEEVVQAACEFLQTRQPAMLISITAGALGSWSFDGGAPQFVPALRVPVANTAGAGDAHLAGILAGLSWGLPLAKAQEIGTLVAAQSVTSPHTIHPGIHARGLADAAKSYRAPLSDEVAGLLARLEQAGVEGEVSDAEG